MLYNTTIYRQNEGSHHTFHKESSLVHLLLMGMSLLASLGDGRENHLNLRELSVEIMKVLLTQVWSSWCCQGHQSGSTGHLEKLFFQGIEEEKGSGFSKPSHPSQTTGPGHPDLGWSQWSPLPVLLQGGCSCPQWCRFWVLSIVKLMNNFMVDMPEDKLLNEKSRTWWDRRKASTEPRTNGLSAMRYRTDTSSPLVGLVLTEPCESSDRKKSKSVWVQETLK